MKDFSGITHKLDESLYFKLLSSLMKVYYLIFHIPEESFIMGKIITKQYSGLQSKNIVMSNIVTRSAQGLSLAEKRILFAAIAKMVGGAGDVRISAQEYAETFEMPVKQAYDQLKSASESFWNRYLTISVPDRKGLLNWKIRWVSAYGYHDGEGFVSLSFTKEMMPYLVELENQFTQYQLKQASSLRSLHSWRLLELFEQMKGSKDVNGWLSIQLEQFWHAMEASESYRKNFSLLRKWVIEPAVKELTEKDNWLVQWEAIKTGRKVTMLRFNFQRDPQGRLL